MGRWVTVALAVALLAGVADPARAQATTGGEAVPDSTQLSDSVVVADSVSLGLSPSGAFLRGAIIPGWGHASSGSLTRGAFYFGAETLAGWMLFKTARRLGVARDQAGLWEERVTARLMSEGVSDEMQIEALLEEHEEVARYRGLVRAREEQREDWLAVAIFTLLLSGVDAFVSAHLRDFPEALTIEGDPDGGTIELGFRIPAG